MKAFDISYSGLKVGEHQFEFEIDDGFFKAHKALEIVDGELKALITLIRQERLLIFNISIKGQVTLTCDRCLDTFEYPMNTENTMYVKIQSGMVGMEEESDAVVVISENEHTINMAQFIYEFIMLAKPMHPTHDEVDDECNEEMLDIMNDINEAHPSEEILDMRWATLKEIRNKF